MGGAAIHEREQEWEPIRTRGAGGSHIADFLILKLV